MYRNVLENQHKNKMEQKRLTLYIALCYVVIEFVRPQSMYESLSHFPIAKICILVFSFFFLIEQRDYFVKNSINLAVLAFATWVAISATFAIDTKIAWNACIDFLKWIFIYFLVINTINTRRGPYLFVITLLLCYFKMGQFAVRRWIAQGFYSDPRGTYVGAGFLHNPDDFGAGVNTVFGIAWYMIHADKNTKWKGWFKAKWFHIINTISLIIGILITSSRGAALALGANLLAIWKNSSRKLAALIIVVLLAYIFWLLIPEDNKARFYKMGTEADTTAQTRFTLWRCALKMVSANPITGIGIGNFPLACKVYECPRVLAQHNIFIQALSELGYPGLFILIIIFFLAFYNNHKVRKTLREAETKDDFLYNLSLGLDVGLIGFAVAGCFITVLFYPFFWVHLMICVTLRDVTEKEYRQSKK